MRLEPREWMTYDDSDRLVGRVTVSEGQFIPHCKVSCVIGGTYSDRAAAGRAVTEHAAEQHPGSFRRSVLRG